MGNAPGSRGLLSLSPGRDVLGIWLGTIPTGRRDCERAVLREVPAPQSTPAAASAE